MRVRVRVRGGVCVLGSWGLGWPCIVSMLTLLHGNARCWQCVSVMNTCHTHMQGAFGHPPTVHACHPVPCTLLSPLPSTLQAAAKRYRVTGSGKVVARHSGKQHMNEKQTRAKKRELAKSFVVSPSDIYKASRCLPYADLQ